MEIFNRPDALERYLSDHSSPEDPVLCELSRHTYLNEVHPNMLSGHVMGGFLKLFSQIVAPESILEIGTYTGYSTICLAKGLRSGGHLTTIEINDELREISLHFFEKAGISSQVNLINGDALSILPSLKECYDLVFIDANKEEYLDYYNLIIEKVVKGGYLLIDNVLWGGKVLEESASDQTTGIIKAFNRLIAEDERVENLILPIRDGIMVIKRL